MRSKKAIATYLSRLASNLLTTIFIRPLKHANSPRSQTEVPFSIGTIQLFEHKVVSHATILRARRDLHLLFPKTK